MDLPTFIEIKVLQIHAFDIRNMLFQYVFWQTPSALVTRSPFSWLSPFFFHFLSECSFCLFVRSELLHHFIVYEKLDCSSLGLVRSVQVVLADGCCLFLSHAQYFLWQRFNTAASIDLHSFDTVGRMQKKNRHILSGSSLWPQAAMKHGVQRKTCWQGFSFPSQQGYLREGVPLIHLLPAVLSKNSC